MGMIATRTAAAPGALRHLSLAVLLLLTLGGCAPFPERTVPITVMAPDLSDGEAVKRALRAQLRLWRGTPYDYGGLSRDGVDCSGFVYATYRSRFGIVLPRTTAGQSRIGRHVARDDLRPGDLVFFRIGGKGRHVGIYLDDRRFVHASTSQGVTLSDLANPYWDAHYWKAVRVRP